MDLSSPYLGLTLKNPFVIGASPLTADLDSLRRLEDAGAGAVVLPSLFEEQITEAESGRIHHRDRTEDDEVVPALSAFPLAEQFTFTPDSYLEFVTRAKAALAIPVVASLNGMTTESWVSFARHIECAGADALELNIYQVTTDATQSSLAFETDLRNVIVELKRHVRLPIAAKVSPFFTAFGHLAHSLDRAGVDGLVMFIRFYQPDIDIVSLALVPHLELSTSSELLLRLRWLSLLRGSVRCSLAATGGVATATDVVKALLAGADVVQLVSTILRHGPRYLPVMRTGLRHWMEAREYPSLEVVRGLLSVGQLHDASVFERGNYLRTLQSWRP